LVIAASADGGTMHFGNIARAASDGGQLGGVGIHVVISGPVAHATADDTV
jgi:hypothetical protein